MAGRLAVDFGTSNTLAAVWDPARQEAAPLPIPDFGRTLLQGGQPVSVIPSLIHYPAEGRQWVGNQVIAHGLARSNSTFRWMKRYIVNRSPVRIHTNGRSISHQEAARDFLTSVLLFAAQAIEMGDEEVAFSVPVEAFEHYENWLAETAAAARMPRFRLIDEPSAAALGYGAQIQPGQVYLIFDFGGGTLDVSVVLMEAVEQATKQAGSGRRCRVLGKAGSDLGGASVDQWLFQETLRRAGLSDFDEAVRVNSSALLVACEEIKEQLSFREQARLSLQDPASGLALETEFTAGQLEELLDQQDAFTRIDRTIRRALNSARERGYGEDTIRSVLMVGGSSQIPSVQRAVRRIFGRERVLLDRPLDAIGRGAAAFIAGVDFYDHIQHDYAIRYLDSNKGGYDYRVIVPRGTPYPSQDPVARLSVKATYAGQTRLGIAIFELGERRAQEAAGRVELVFDPSGAARVSRLTAEEAEQRAQFWMNEHQPTFLRAEPPAQPGDTRFEVEFSIDGNKRLLLTARDLLSGQAVYQDYPVVKLA